MRALQRLFYAGCAAFLVSSSSLLAQDAISVEAVLEETQIEMGITTYLQLNVKGGQPEQIPNEIQAPGLTIGDASRPPAFTYSHTNVNGVPVAQSKYLYPVTGHSPGTFTIPSIQLRIRGKDIATSPVKIAILKLSGSRPLNSSQPQFLNFSATKTEAYVNEAIPIELELYVQGSNSIASSDRSRPKFENSAKFGIKHAPTFHPSTKQIDGLPFSCRRFSAQIAALVPGEHVLGPALMEFEVTNSGAGQFAKATKRLPEKRKISSNELSFTIKPLPEQGRPASFQGAVGSWELEVRATPLELRAGDPLSIEMIVRGTGNFDSLNPPKLPESDGWRVYPVTKVDNPEGTDSQTVTYAQVVIPLKKHEALPALELSFFDPGQEKYVIQHSPAVPLKIIPDPAADPASGSAVLSQIGFQGEQLDDILFIHTGTPSWRPLTGSLVTQPSFWAWQLLPFSAVAGLAGGWAWRRWRDWKEEQRRRFEMTLEKVKARSGHSISRAEFYSVVLEYFERWHVKHPQLPANLSARSKDAIERMLQAGNSLLYAGSGAAATPAPASNQEKQDVLSALAELESLAPIA